MSTLGQGIEFEFEGERYRIAPIGPGVRSAFVLLFKSRAWREVDEQRKIVDAARWQRLESYTSADMATGKYEWGGLFHADVMDTRIGVGLELLARIRIAHPDVSEELVFRMGDSWGWDQAILKINSADGRTLPKETAPPTESAGASTSQTKTLSEQSLSATPDNQSKPS